MCREIWWPAIGGRKDRHCCVPVGGVLLFVRMKLAEALTRLRPHCPELRTKGVRSLSIFGSTARGEARVDSDVDVLVEFEGPATLDSYLALKERLEQVLQTRVDLVTSKGVKPRLKKIIEREAVLVA